MNALLRRRLHRIVQQGGRGDVRPGTGTAEEKVRYVFAVEADAIQRAAKRRQRFGAVKKRGAYKCPKAGGVALRPDDGFDGAAGGPRGSEVVSGQVADPAYLERVSRNASPPEQ